MALHPDELVKLPLDEQSKSALSPEASEKIDGINAQFYDLKSELKSIELEKGKTSRAIGKAKKAGDSDKAEQLKTDVKRFALASKEVKQKILALRESATELIATSSEPDQSAPYRFTHFASTQSTNSTPTIVELAESDYGRWDAYVAQEKRCSVYHLSAFKKVVESTFGHRCIYLMAVDTENQIVGILPSVQLKSTLFGNFLVSVPFFNYGGAVAQDVTTENMLMEQLNQKARLLGAEHIEYRDINKREQLPAKTEKNSLFLRLPQTADSLWDQIGSKVRAQIKKSMENNFTFKSGGAELLDDFYRVFSINMRDLGTPVYSKAFFRNLLADTDINSTLGVVYFNDKPISCAYLIGHQDTLEIPWASTLRDYNRLNANMYLYWNVISLAIEKQYEFFDFGRSSKEAGTFKFKQQWGAEPSQLYWHYWLASGGDLPQINPNNPKFKLLVAVWKRLPIGIANLLGPMIVKNLP